MEYTFSAYQIAELAIKVEEEGMRFYSQLAEIVRDKKIKELFLLLANIESKHKDSFSAIAEESKKNNLSYDYSIDLHGLMENIIDKIKRSALDARSLADGKIDVDHSLAFAIHLESEAIRVYTAIQDTFIDRFHGVLERIIREEKEHLRMLTETRDKLMGI